MKLDLSTNASRDTLRTPGMYIEWRTDALAGRVARPTGVPVFVGFVRPGAFAADAPRARWFDRWERFAAAFGRAGASTLLMHAVRGFFENGGERCLVVPVQAQFGFDGREATYGQALKLADDLAGPFDEGGLLDGIEGVDLVCVPDAMTPALARHRDCVVSVQSSATEHCARMGERFAVLDAMSVGEEEQDQDGGGMAPRERLPAAIAAAIAQWQTLPARHGALYFPWLEVKALAGDGARPTVRVPPCGHIAGVIARSDRRIGVHKPPANEPLDGVLDIDFDLSDGDQAALNEAGINCLRERPGWGLRVWGARTLCDRPELRYVNVTRLMLSVTRELEHRLCDLVFEPNNESLWAAVADRLTGFCADLYRSGALKGNEAAEAFFVKCDAETNSTAAGAKETRDPATLFALVGLAPVAPAEFVIVRVTQSAAGVTVTGPATQT